MGQAQVKEKTGVRKLPYVSAITERTGCVLKVHTSNFTMTGFTSSVDISDLAGLGVPLVVDVGSGLLNPDRVLPHEPDITSALRSGAEVVTASGDKSLGGPQAGVDHARDLPPAERPGDDPQFDLFHVGGRIRVGSGPWDGVLFRRRVREIKLSRETGGRPASEYQVSALPTLGS